MLDKRVVRGLTKFVVPGFQSKQKFGEVGWGGGGFFGGGEERVPLDKVLVEIVREGCKFLMDFKLGDLL